MSLSEMGIVFRNVVERGIVLEARKCETALENVGITTDFENEQKNKVKLVVASDKKLKVSEMLKIRQEHSNFDNFVRFLASLRCVKKIESHKTSHVEFVRVEFAKIASFHIATPNRNEASFLEFVIRNAGFSDLKQISSYVEEGNMQPYISFMFRNKKLMTSKEDLEADKLTITVTGFSPTNFVVREVLFCDADVGVIFSSQFNMRYGLPFLSQMDNFGNNAKVSHEMRNLIEDLRLRMLFLGETPFSVLGYAIFPNEEKFDFWSKSHNVVVYCKRLSSCNVKHVHVFDNQGALITNLNNVANLKAFEILEAIPDNKSYVQAVYLNLLEGKKGVIHVDIEVHLKEGVKYDVLGVLRNKLEEHSKNCNAIVLHRFCYFLNDYNNYFNRDNLFTSHVTPQKTNQILTHFVVNSLQSYPNDLVVVLDKPQSDNSLFARLATCFGANLSSKRFVIPFKLGPNILYPHGLFYAVRDVLEENFKFNVQPTASLYEAGRVIVALTGAPTMNGKFSLQATSNNIGLGYTAELFPLYELGNGLFSFHQLAFAASMNAMGAVKHLFHVLVLGSAQEISTSPFVTKLALLDLRIQLFYSYGRSNTGNIFTFSSIFDAAKLNLRSMQAMQVANATPEGLITKIGTFKLICELSRPKSNAKLNKVIRVLVGVADYSSFNKFPFFVNMQENICLGVQVKQFSLLQKINKKIGYKVFCSAKTSSIALGNHVLLNGTVFAGYGTVAEVDNFTSGACLAAKAAGYFVTHFNRVTSLKVLVNAFVSWPFENSAVSKTLNKNKTRYYVYVKNDQIFGFISSKNFLTELETLNKRSLLSRDVLTSCQTSEIFPCCSLEAEVALYVFLANFSFTFGCDLELIYFGKLLMADNSFMKTVIVTPFFGVSTTGIPFPFRALVGYNINGASQISFSNLVVRIAF